MSFQIRDRVQDESGLMDESLARVVVSEETGEIMFANDRFAMICDRMVDEISGHKLHELVTLADGDGLQDLVSLDDGVCAISPVYGSDDLYSFQFDHVKSKNGAAFVIATEIDPEQELDSPSKSEMQEFVDRLKLRSIDQVQESLLEISRKNLGSLRENSDLKRFLDMSHDVMIVADETGKLVRVNETFERMFGMGEGDLKDVRFFDLFREADRPTIRTMMQNLIVNEDDVNVIDFESEIETRDGQKYFMEWRQSYKNDYVYCVGRDVTAVRRHEMELSTRQSQLEEAEILGRMGRWRWVIGQDEIEWSDQIYRIFGVLPSKFTPTIDTLNDMIYRRDVGRVVQAFQRAIIEQNDYDMEFRIKRSAGDVRFIRCEGRCERDDEGEVVALYGIMQDMTERMLYERELKAAKEGVERAYAAKSQFLANMSHELRTPLNAIIGFSEMMQRQLLGPIGTEKYLDYIGGIRESGEHLLDLISDILDMSKIEAGKYEMDWEEINVSKIMKLAAHMMEGRAQDSSVKISTSKLKNEELTIIADRRAFMQIMLNLLSNAVKFSKENGEVWLECQEREDFISIRVCDNGVGIPANKLSCVTQPFEQAASSYDRPYEGSGLGLSITKELVNMHNGTLLIDSTVDVGTTVTVRLPHDPTKKSK